MKKYLIIATYACLILSVNANNKYQEVYLDLSDNKPTVLNTTNYKINIEKSNYSNIKDSVDDNYLKNVQTSERDLYSKKTFSDKKEKKIGEKTTIGAQYDTTINPDSASQTRTLYTKYDITDKMSVNSSYKTDSLGGVSGQTKGTVGIGPEYQMNKKLRFKNFFSKNLSDESNKAEVSVQYQPFSDDRMDFSAGASQIQQDNGSSSRSQVNFGTNFKF